MHKRRQRPVSAGIQRRSPLAFECGADARRVRRAPDVPLGDDRGRQALMLLQRLSAAVRSRSPAGYGLPPATTRWPNNRRGPGGRGRTGGIGSIASYATEVALPATGTWKKPGVGSARAHAAVVAPENGVPLLFIEARQLPRGRGDDRREIRQVDAVLPAHREGHRRPGAADVAHPLERPQAQRKFSLAMPPVLLVFHQIGARPARTQMQKVAEGLPVPAGRLPQGRLCPQAPSGVSRT